MKRHSCTTLFAVIMAATLFACGGEPTDEAGSGGGNNGGATTNPQPDDAGSGGQTENLENVQDPGNDGPRTEPTPAGSPGDTMDNHGTDTDTPDNTDQTGADPCDDFPKLVELDGARIYCEAIRGDCIVEVKVHEGVCGGFCEPAFGRPASDIELEDSTLFYTDSLGDWACSLSP